MTFKEWYQNKHLYKDTEIFPYIKITEEVTIEKVTKELERLGFGRGNDFSKYKGFVISTIDIWYADFYNLFMNYTSHEDDFEFTYEELKEIESD